MHANGDYELSLVDHAESHDFYSWTNPEYYFHYNSKKVQELYAKSLASTDSATSEKYLKQAARIVSEDAPADWLFGYRVTVARDKNLHGFPGKLSTCCRYGRSTRPSKLPVMKFIIQRLGLFIAALAGLSLLVFLALRILPGDVAAVIAGTKATPERIAALRSQLDGRFLSGAIRGLDT